MSQLGRISGPLLKENLLRNGADLAFETDLLYLDVITDKIGINSDAPTHDLYVNGTTKTTDFIGLTTATLDNVIVNASGTISTTVGALEIRPLGPNPTMYYQRMIVGNLTFNDTTIESPTNQNIILDPHGTGKVELQSSTNITGDLHVSGNINVTGNLRSDGTVYIGDSIFDTVTIAPDLTQSIIPGIDITYDLGKSNKRWNDLYLDTTTGIDNATGLGDIIISDQLRINGLTNEIFAMQSNEDVLLNPDTGITYIERTSWQDDTITNLNNTPLTFANTGIGYVRFMGTNAFVIPSGPTVDQHPTPEVGETRWNTDLDYLECFDGTVWKISTGGGATVTQAVMQEIADVYTLMLG